MTDPHLTHHPINPPDRGPKYACCICGRKDFYRISWLSSLLCMWPFRWMLHPVTTLKRFAERARAARLHADVEMMKHTTNVLRGTRKPKSVKIEPAGYFLLPPPDDTQ